MTTLLNLFLSNQRASLAQYYKQFYLLLRWISFALCMFRTNILLKAEVWIKTLIEKPRGILIIVEANLLNKEKITSMSLGCCLVNFYLMFYRRDPYVVQIPQPSIFIKYITLYQVQFKFGLEHSPVELCNCYMNLK